MKAMNVTVQQEHFLTNENNKTRLIQLLSDKMTRGIETVVATGDADGTIVRCGLEKAALHPTVTIIGEDVDLIVLLIAFARPGSNVYFMKPGRGRWNQNCFQQTNSNNFLLLKPSSFSMPLAGVTPPPPFTTKAKEEWLSCSARFPGK